MAPQLADESEQVIVVDDAAAARRRRRNIIIVVVACWSWPLAAFFMFGRRRRREDSGRSRPQASGKGGAAQAPAVTVIVPGRQQVARTISATGHARGAPRHAGRHCRRGRPGRPRPGRARPVGRRRPDARRHRPLGPGPGSAAARRADRGRPRRRAARPAGARSRPGAGRRAASSPRPTSSAASRPATPPMPGSASPRRNSAPARARIGRLDVRAPAAGLVLDRNVEPGQVVSAGSGALFRIAQGGEMELLARLPQTDLSPSRVGVPVTVTPVGSQQSYQGSVWQISPIIDPQTRQGEARISIPYNRELRPGGFAAAEIRAGAIDRAAASRIRGADRRCRHFRLSSSTRKHGRQRRAVRIGDVTDKRRGDRRGAERQRAGRSVGRRRSSTRARRCGRSGAAQPLRPNRSIVESMNYA